MTEADPMVDEFDTVASWTVDAVAELGEDHALPAACRGSGSPAALDWLAAATDLRSGITLLDSGAGVGGPAEYVARSVGAVPTLAEPMEQACRAARSLFARPVVAADGLALPFPDGSFDCAWSLGVLCTVDDKRAYLGELGRVVRPGGGVGLLVYARTVEELPDQPEGNSFPSRPELRAHLADCDLTVLDEVLLSELPDVPPEWQRAADRVDEVIERRHSHDERWKRAQSQQRTITGLITDGLVAGVLVSCRAPARPRGLLV